MQNICRILQLTDISIMAVERDKSQRECMLLRMSTRDGVPLSFIENIDSQVVKFIFPANVKV